MKFSPKAWEQVNRQLLAKSIQELSYEQILTPVSTGTDGDYRISLDRQVEYRFKAWRGDLDRFQSFARIDQQIFRKQSDRTQRGFVF